MQIYKKMFTRTNIYVYTRVMYNILIYLTP